MSHLERAAKIYADPPYILLILPFDFCGHLHNFVVCDPRKPQECAVLDHQRALGYAVHIQIRRVIDDQANGDAGVSCNIRPPAGAGGFEVGHHAVIDPVGICSRPCGRICGPFKLQHLTGLIPNPGISHCIQINPLNPAAPLFEKVSKLMNKQVKIFIVGAVQTHAGTTDSASTAAKISCLGNNLSHRHGHPSEQNCASDQPALKDIGAGGGEGAFFELNI